MRLGSDGAKVPPGETHAAATNVGDSAANASATATSPMRRWEYLVVAVLLLLHFALGVGSKLHESTTSDEIAHLTSGVAYWTLDDYRLQPENGNLPQRWAALPSVIAGTKLTPADNHAWQTSNVWFVGHTFFYDSGIDHFPRLMAARAMIALFSVATGVLVFAWSRRLFGAGAAVLSLTLFAFSPIFLAHGALATSDVCAAFFLLAAVGAYWRHLHEGRSGAWVLSAAVFGLACVAKFSAVLLLPMMAIMAAARALEPTPWIFLGRTHTTVRARLGALLLSGVGHAALAILVIWTFYGFRYAAFNPALPGGRFIVTWPTIQDSLGFQAGVIHLLRALHALPEAFLYGYSYVVVSAQTRAAFLNGAISMTGWRTFFPWTLLLKTTLPVLLLSAAVGLAAAVRWLGRPGTLRRDLYRVMPLVTLFGVYWAFAIPSHLNIGQRHILPTYPVLFIAAGALIALARAYRAPIAAVLAALAGWHAVEAVRIAPHFLAYFNEFAGGPAHGYRHLVDSSLDWGQDLPGLADWLKARDLPSPTTPVYLAYFGTGDPAYYGIHAVDMVPLLRPKQEAWYRLEPGVYCISTTMLSEVYGYFRGPWTAAMERQYRELQSIEPALLFYNSHPQNRPDLERETPAVKWLAMWESYEQLMFKRLCVTLRAREPDAQIGYSINIYRLSAKDIAEITGRPMTH